MTTNDKQVLKPDTSPDKSELVNTTQDTQPDIDYGILIYTDTKGQHQLQIVGRENTNLDDLLALIELGHRKLCILWDSRHNPATKVVIQEINALKEMGTKNNQALQAIGQILRGLCESLQDTHNQSDTHAEEVDASTSEDSI